MSLPLAVPGDALGVGADRLRGHGGEVRATELWNAQVETIGTVDAVAGATAAPTRRGGD